MDKVECNGKREVAGLRQWCVSDFWKVGRVGDVSAHVMIPKSTVHEL